MLATNTRSFIGVQFVALDRRPDLPDLSDEQAQALVRRIRVELAQRKDRAANATMVVLQEEIVRRLRRIVWTGYPNRGEDIIIDALDRIYFAIFQPKSADGAALTTKFQMTVYRRALDALEEYNKRRRRHVDLETGHSGELELPPGVTPADNALVAQVYDTETEERVAWLEARIAEIEDNETRLAIRLYKDGMNMGKGKQTIAMALGCDPKTASAKVARAKDILRAGLRREGR